MMRMNVMGAVLAAGTLMSLPVLADSTSNGRGFNELTVIAPGQNYTCAIDREQEVVCSAAVTVTPTRVGVSNAANVSLYGEDACATTRGGELYCWQLSGVLIGPPQKIAGFGPGAGKNAISVVRLPHFATSSDSTCALANNGKVYCWGENEGGQLGDGTTVDRATPTEVKGVSGVVSLSAGSSRGDPLTCAVRYTGGVRCWGGRGMHTPIAITGAGSVREVVIGTESICLWRTSESMSEVHCAWPDAAHITDFSNFTRMDVIHPVAIAGNAKSNICIADLMPELAWKCLNALFGLEQTPRAGFLTTLIGHAPLVLGNEDHSCAEFPDQSLRCLEHGTLISSCDLAAEGDDCIDASGTDAAAGTWELVPNTLLAERRQPEIGRASDPKLVARTRSALIVSWIPHATSTDHRVTACDRYDVCRNASVIQQSGDRRVAVVSGLQPGTDYNVTMQGYNWGSVQGVVGLGAATSP